MVYHRGRTLLTLFFYVSCSIENAFLHDSGVYFKKVRWSVLCYWTDDLHTGKMSEQRQSGVFLWYTCIFKHDATLISTYLTVVLFYLDKLRMDAEGWSSKSPSSFNNHAFIHVFFRNVRAFCRPMEAWTLNDYWFFVHNAVARAWILNTTWSKQCCHPQLSIKLKHVA